MLVRNKKVNNFGGYHIASRDPEVLQRVIAALTSYSMCQMLASFPSHFLLLYFSGENQLGGKRETLMLIKTEILKIL